MIRDAVLIIVYYPAYMLWVTLAIITMSLRIHKEVEDTIGYRLLKRFNE